MTEILQTPIKSQNDKNNYRLMRLANGLKVLLIQHPKDELGSERLASLVMNIDVGGYDDPSDAKGLSHFLEHMVFMGSEKYPKENEYHEFITNNGGDLNAMTGYRETIYYFSIVEEALEGAIDRLSSIFVAPLMLENSIERELESVESEYRNRLTNDYVRMMQMMYDNIIEGNPGRAFMVGNLETLKKNRSNLDLYQLVHEHRRKFYVSNRMCLAIESSLDLDDLQTMTEKYFEGIASGEMRSGLPIDDYKNIFKPQFYEKITYMKPKIDKRLMLINWPFPSSTPHYKTKPLHYLATLIKSEHSGGIVSYLKKKLLVTSLQVEYDSGLFGDVPIFSQLTIHVNMTEYGSNRTEEILKGICSYLALIQQAPIERHQEIYESRKIIAENSFRFQEAESPLTNTKNAVQAMNLYDDVDVLRSETLYQEFDGEILKKYFDIINENFFNIFIINHESDVDYDEIEPYFGAEFKRVDLNEEIKKIWSEKIILEELSLPIKNNYVCSNFDIVADMEGVEKMENPVRILDNEIAEAWYKLDSKFKVPRVNISVTLNSPLITGSVFNFTLLKIFENLLTEYLDEKYSNASDAGMSCGFYLSRNAISIGFKGYSEKIKEFVNDVTKDLMNFNEYLNNETFEIEKTRLYELYKSSLSAGRYFSSIIYFIVNQFQTNDYELYQQVSQVTFEHLEKFVEKFFNKLRVKILIQGNLIKDDAINMTEIILNNINTAPLEDLSVIKQLNRQLPLGRTSIKIKSLQKDDKNSWLSNYFDVGARSARNDALVTLLEAVLEEPTFDILRTKEQLAYQVGIVHREMDHSNILAISIKFQEDKYSSSFIAERIKKFFTEDMKTIVENLDDEKFQKVKEGQIREYREPFTTLGGEAGYNFNRIQRENYIFDEYEKQAVALEKITKQDLIDFYTRTFITEKHRNVIIQLVGNASEEDFSGDETMTLKFITEKNDDEDFIVTDLREFKTSLPFHPSYVHDYD